MEHLSNDHKDCSNQDKNSHDLFNEMGHPIVGMTERQWKLRQQHEQNFLMEGKPLQNKFYPETKERNPKEQEFESHSQGIQVEKLTI